MSEPAEHDLPHDLNAPVTPEAGIVALRVLAVVTALLTLAAGIVLAISLDLGVVLIIAWCVLVVPGVTLAMLMIVDRLPRRR